LHGFGILEAREHGRLSRAASAAGLELKPPTPPEEPTKSNFLHKLKRLSFNAKAKTAASSASDTPPGTGALPLFRTDSRGEYKENSRHAAGYSWTVRKWIRRELDGIQLSFEWTKVKSRRQSRRRQSKRMSLRPGDLDAEPVNRRASMVLTGEEATEDPNRLVRRRQREAGAEENGWAEDEESEPEDSESPWKCEIVVGGVRTLLGTFTPAPHHPKLVGHLAIRAELTPIGTTKRGVAVTVEECKDILAVTILWLITREALGGVAKKRKGDGQWRLGT
jgi:hypothetical protein